MQIQAQAPTVSMDKPLNSSIKDVKTEKAHTPHPVKVATPEVNAQKDEAATEVENGSSYLRVISRMENMAQKQELNDLAIESFAKAIKIRVGEMTDPEKRTLLSSPEAKNIGLKQIDELPKKILEMLRDKDLKNNDKVFNLLKQPSFAELMSEKAKQPAKTYNAQGVAASKDAKATGDTPKVVTVGAGATASPGVEASAHAQASAPAIAPKLTPQQNATVQQMSAPIIPANVIATA